MKCPPLQNCVFFAEVDSSDRSSDYRYSDCIGLRKKIGLSDKYMYRTSTFELAALDFRYSIAISKSYRISTVGPSKFC